MSSISNKMKDGFGEEVREATYIDRVGNVLRVEKRAKPFPNFYVKFNRLETYTLLTARQAKVMMRVDNPQGLAATLTELTRFDGREPGN